MLYLKLKSTKANLWLQQNKNKAISIGCVGMAFILVYVVPSFFNRTSEEKIVYISSTNIKSGEQITQDMIDKIKVESKDLPKSVFLDEEDIVGKYALNNINNEDLINSNNISDTPLSENNYFNSLENGKQAISVSIKSLAKGLSNKLEVGDIVSVIVPNEDTEDVYIPEELRYVEVISVTDDDGYDTVSTSNEKNLSSTITLLVNEEQAKILALLEDTKDIHFSLITRNNEELKQSLLEKQASFFDEKYPENSQTTEIIEEIEEELMEDILE